MTDKKIAIYTRVSTEYQVDKDSLPMQRKDLVAYSQLVLNCDNYEIFEDAGYSGKNTQRPKFQEMMSRVRNHEFTHILVWKIDRISRNLLDFAQMYEELKRLGVIFVSKNEQFDTSSAMGEAMLKIILVFAELERNMTAERVTATMVSRANNGLWNGGRVPFGYDYDSVSKTFSVNEKEAEVVRYMHNRYEELRSIVLLAYEMNDKGLRTKGGYEWSPAGISHVLNNIFYTGDYMYNVHKSNSHTNIKKESEWVMYKNHHPEIISHEQKNRVCSILSFNDRGKKTGRRNVKIDKNRIHIFSGTLRCSRCGKMMYASPRKFGNGTKYSLYECPTSRFSKTRCGQKSVSDIFVGEFVMNFILNMMKAKDELSNGMDSYLLGRYLLNGAAFRDVKEIIGLDDMYMMLSGSYSGSFEQEGGNDAISAQSQIDHLRQNRIKYQRALSRLSDLYLYSDNAISEKDYILRKAAIEKQIEDADSQIAAIENNMTATDEDVLSAASTFVLAQSMKGKNYINFRDLLETVDHKIILDFVVSTLSAVYFDNDQITEIEFANGLDISFTYKTPGE